MSKAQKQRGAKPSRMQGLFNLLTGNDAANGSNNEAKQFAPDYALPLASATSTYFTQPGKAVWMGRDYARFAEEAYRRNVIAHRAIRMVAEAAASVPWKLSMQRPEGAVAVNQHPLLSLMECPSPRCQGTELIENMAVQRLLAGNVFLLAVGADSPREIYTLRPDRVQVIAGRGGLPAAYDYTVDGVTRRYPVDAITGRSQILHLKTFHPTDDWHGLSPVEAAAYSIDQHNQAAQWNQALLQNGAKPSGALVVKGEGSGNLSDEQFDRLKAEMQEQFSGAANAGRPLLLEGGLEWQEMSLSPKDMDFMEAKHSAARDIALAFGVPPQLLGIPGDNTYSNLAEARLALWEQTVLPMLDHFAAALNGWLVPMFPQREGHALKLSYDVDGIHALGLRREKLWKRLNEADFLTQDEKRKLAGVDGE